MNEILEMINKLIKRPVRIMQITYGLNYGGLEQVILNLYQFLDKSRFNVSVCCMTQKGHVAHELEKLGCKIEYCDSSSRLNPYSKFLKIAAILKKHKIDIVHTHNTPAYFDGLVAAKLVNIPVVIHTDHCRFYPDKKRYMLAERLASLVTDRIIAVSAHTKRDLEKWEHISSRKIDVILNGIPPLNSLIADQSHQLRTSLGIKKNEKVIGSVGRLEYQKGYELLIQAAAIIENTKYPIKFVIVGEGSKKDELQQLIEQFNLAEKVILTGGKTNGVDYIQMFDMFALTSNFEGMPIVLLEAMAAKKPIVATNVGGVPEMIDHGMNGYLVNTRDPKVFAKYCHQLIDNPELMKNFGEHSYQKYVNEFTIDQMVRSYSKLYYSCLSRYFGVNNHSPVNNEM